MTQLYIIRHAEAEGNIYRRIDGHYNSRITANGYRQIDALTERFKSIPVDAVYASDLFRTCETAKAIYVPKGLELHKDARFRETAFGVWEDKNFGWLEQFESGEFDRFSHNPDSWRTEGAEQAKECSDRFLTALNEIAQKHNGQTVAVFSHGCVTGYAFRRLFGENAKKAGRCDNSGVSLIRYEGGKFSFEYLYDNSHLTEEISTLAHQLWWRGKRDFNLWFRTPQSSDRSLFDPEHLPCEGHKTLIAVLADRPVGYLSYSVQGNTVTVSCLYLIAECRHVRMGDQLLGTAVVEGRAIGCTELKAVVPYQNKDAAAFFARLGARSVKADHFTVSYSMPIGIPVY